MNRWEKLSRIPAPHFAPKFGPLTGMRVLLSGTVVAAPFAAQLLGDFGAELIQVEFPKIGDAYRYQSPQLFREDGEAQTSAAWAQGARNRMSFTLNTNMSIPEAKEIFFCLIKQVDVWIENMVWLKKLGIELKELWEVNPKLIVGHASGFGRPQFGGNEDTCNRPSYDPIGQAESGFMSINGDPEPEPPRYAASFVNDYLTATFLFGGICAAYVNVLNGGMGQEVDMAQVEAFARVLDDQWISYIEAGVLKKRAGNRVPIFQPASLHKASDGRWCFIGAFGKSVYYRAIKGLGLDPDYFKWEEAGNSFEAVWSDKGKELYEEVNKWFAARPAQEAQEHMNKYKIPVGVVKNIKEIYEDPHWHDRKNFIKYHDQTLDREVEAFGFVPKFSETPGKAWRGAPRLGQDTPMIMRELLGYSDEEIASLKGKSIID